MRGEKYLSIFGGFVTAEAKKISFNIREGADFATTLKERVSLYFKNHGLSVKANWSMIGKSIFYLSTIALLYGLLLSNIGGLGAVFGIYLLIGFLNSIGTMNISHDALHGAYFSKSWGNRALGFIMDIAGASSFYWKKEHTIDHHTFTNIAEHDADLDVPFVLRLCPQAKRRWFHRFQQFYAPILYCLNFIHWVYVSDIKRIVNIFKNWRSPPGNPSKSEIALLLTFKVVHIMLFLVLPILCLPFAWWQIGLAYLSFLAIGGLTMTTIFQLAHIVENVAFPSPSNEGKIETGFIEHQFATTSNFATKSKLVRFLFGGLNFQVEHHIFPNICHAHLPKIASIVKDTANEFGIAYNENPSLFAALRSHFRTLKKFGHS
jgi:linoleoyl-CoA desaturase